MSEVRRRILVQASIDRRRLLTVIGDRRLSATRRGNAAARLADLERECERLWQLLPEHELPGGCVTWRDWFEWLDLESP